MPGDNPRSWKPRPSTRTRGTCKVRGCGRLRHNDISRYCAGHAARMYRHGHPEGFSRVPNRAHDRSYDWITQELKSVAGHPAMDAALVLADELLHYKPSRGYSWEHAVTKQGYRLLDHGVTPFDILVRVVELANYERVRPMRTPRERDYAYARAVLRAAPLHRFRAEGALLKYLGALVLDRLDSFAQSFLRLIDRRAEARKALLDTSSFDSTPATGSALTDSTIDTETAAHE